MYEKLIHHIVADCKELFNADVQPIVSRPDEQFGDYACNVAMQLAKELGQNPREIAAALREKLQVVDGVKHVEIAGPGFINIFVEDEVLVGDASNISPYQHHEGKEVLVEFGNFNPLKTVHLGHLYQTVVYSAIARLFERSGATVHTISYHGDVGMHIAKAIWAIGEEVGWKPQDLKALEDGEESDVSMRNMKTIFGSYYAKGNEAYDADSSAAESIREVNRHIYDRDNQAVNDIHALCVKRSMQYFDTIYDELGVSFEKHYMESETAPIGTEVVKKNIGNVFEESDGAIIYKGEKDDLHTRVFLNSEGLPTYEAKDLGLIELKRRDYPGADKSVIITGNEQQQYFKVMLAALKHIHPEEAAKTEHMTHGLLSLTTGKMSSRTGNVFGAQSLMDATRAAVSKAFVDSEVQRDIYLAALKYTFLKSRIGGDIVFDVQESVSLEGNSGPYIQYAYARARSILRKKAASEDEITGLEADERSLVRKISEYEEVLEKATKERLPHHICTYLYELAQKFNAFYEKNRVLEHEREAQRLGIVHFYAEVLKDGLETLGIPAPEKM
ncbi:MAG: arginine--tRNA ligase [Candidatus Saccharibacteria bacterium]|nr:arginine--tRNA ligase [Candidatus Saccharibacteria bacterium]